MHLDLLPPIYRRKCRKIMLKGVAVGGGAPISVQSMTNTPTEDFEATREQVARLFATGAELVRVSVNHFEAAEGFSKLCQAFPDSPLIADIHFDWRLALRAIEAGAAGLRLNPGNLGEAQRVKKVLKAAKERDIPIRIGVNSGSLPKELAGLADRDPAQALVEAALDHLSHCEAVNFESIKLSVKSSEPRVAIEAYRRLARLTDHPLHLGITEAGASRAGTVKSSVGLGVLLSEGIGDTLRISLAADPVEEVKVGYELLKALRLRTRGLNLIACPTCSRQEFDVIGVTQHLESRFCSLTDPLDVAIMGCVVNGPGECTKADLGVSGSPHSSPLYEGGFRTAIRLENSQIAQELEKRILEKIKALQPLREASSDCGRQNDPKAG